MHAACPAAGAAEHVSGDARAARQRRRLGRAQYLAALKHAEGQTSAAGGRGGAAVVDVSLLLPSNAANGAAWFAKLMPTDATCAPRRARHAGGATLLRAAAMRFGRAWFVTPAP